MKVKFIETTNDLAKELLNKEVSLSYGMQASFSFDTSDVSFDLRHGSWRTSLIKNISIEEISFLCYNITIETDNSKYVFQKGEFSDRPAFTKKEKLGIALATMVF